MDEKEINARPAEAIVKAITQQLADPRAVMIKEIGKILEKLDTDIRPYEEKGKTAIAEAKSLEVIDTETLKKSREIRLAIQADNKEVEGILKPFTEFFYTNHRRFTTLRGSITDDFVEADSIIGGKQAAYFELQEIERKKAEALAAVAAKNREDAMKKALEVAADELDKKGDIEQAVAFLDEAKNYKAPVFTPEVEKVRGISARENWKVEVVDMAEFLKAQVIIIFDGSKHPSLESIILALEAEFNDLFITEISPRFLDYIRLDTVQLAKKFQSDKTTEYPGLKITQGTTVVVRR